MNENRKTITFVAVAVVAALIAWIGRPSLRGSGVDEGIVGSTLFEKFDDPLQAASLEIIEYDENTATVRPFKVAQVADQWSIPSHDNYPADAKDQLATVAAGMIGLTVLELASDSPGDHALYGVVDPNPRTLKAGDTGVGTRVEMRNRSDEVLLSLIVGKKVPDRDGLRYVRPTGRDAVFVVAMKADKISTKFEDWIEKDLLKLQTWDVRKVRIHDYSVDVLAGVQTPRSDMTLAYDDRESKWKLERDEVFRGGKYVERPLGDDEELNATKLNDMKYALDDLKIVDVARKPEGLSANLRDLGELKKDAESLQSLANCGFYPVQVGKRIELLSSEGEINVLMKDGVQYVLRFGQVTGTGSDASDAAEKEEGADPEDEGETKSKSEGMNRYLFVMAEFNPDIIEKPELEPLPEVEKEGPAGDAAEDKAASEKEEPPAEAEDSAEEDGNDEDAAKEEKEGEKSEIERERERIEKENQRKQDEYDEKIRKGKERVQELNARFADWYYIISNEVYEKIHLGRDDVVKKKEKDEEADKAEEGLPSSDDAAAEKPDDAMEAPEPDADQPDEAEAEKAEPAEKSKEEAAGDSDPAKPEAMPEAEAKPEGKSETEAKPEPEAKPETEQ